MPSIQLQALTLAAPDGRELLQNLDLTLGPVRTGLVGRNGAGKTTLLRAILNEVTPKSGRILVDGRLGVLRQSVSAGDATVAEQLGIASDLARLDRIAAGTADADDIERADWTLTGRVDTALRAVGLPAIALGRSAGTLSGGEQTRLALAATLIGEPDLILLDEPTNNLDAAGRAAVGDFLRGWSGGALVVSHDRTLLRDMDQILDLTSVGAKLYGGNWEDYEARRAQDLAAAEHDLTVSQRQLADIDRKAQQRAERKARGDARGGRKASRGGVPNIVSGAMKRRAEQTGGAQSRLVERQREQATAGLIKARAEIEILQGLSVTLDPSGLAAGRTVLQVENLTGGEGETPIVRNLDLTVTGPERIAVSGPNGSGKTTLLRLLVGAISPLTGSVRISPRHAMLDQHVALLDPALSIRDNYLRLNPADGENACRAALARFTFRADAAHRLSVN